MTCPPQRPARDDVAESLVGLALQICDKENVPLRKQVAAQQLGFLFLEPVTTGRASLDCSGRDRW